MHSGVQYKNHSVAFIAILIGWHMQLRMEGDNYQAESALLKPDVLLHVFNSLEIQDMCTASQVCTVWREVADTHPFWARCWDTLLQAHKQLEAKGSPWRKRMLVLGKESTYAYRTNDAEGEDHAVAPDGGAAGVPEVQVPTASQPPAKRQVGSCVPVWAGATLFLVLAI